MAVAGKVSVGVCADGVGAAYPVVQAFVDVPALHVAVTFESSLEKRFEHVKDETF